MNPNLGPPLVYYAPGQKAVVGMETTKDTPIIISGTLDRLLAQAWGFGWLPKVISNGNLGSLYLREVSVEERKGGVGLWDGTGHYTTIRPSDYQECTWEFDTSVETQHVTVARETISSFNATGEPVVDFQNVIGCTVDGVEGTDVLWPKFEWNENWKLPTTYCDFAYGQILAAITGTTNLNTFRGYPPKYVLFLGATGKWSNRDPLWTDLALKFRVGTAITNLSVNGMTGINKGPWEYLWFNYKQRTDTGGGMSLQLPTHANVVRVYESTDFVRLGIPQGLPSPRNALPAPIYT